MTRADATNRGDTHPHPRHVSLRSDLLSALLPCVMTPLAVVSASSPATAADPNAGYAEEEQPLTVISSEASQSQSAQSLPKAISGPESISTPETASKPDAASNANETVAATTIAQTTVSTDQNWTWTIAALLLTLGGTTTAAIALTSWRLSRPLNQLIQAFEQVSAGNLETYVVPRGSSESQRLIKSFNELLPRLKNLLETQSGALKQAQFYADMAHAASSGDVQTVFDLAVQAAKSNLGVDRVVIYAFEPDWSGSIVAEAVNPVYPKALKDKITDPCIPKATLEEYRKGRFVPTEDVQAARFSLAHKQLLERLEVKANLVVPVVASDRLVGLLVAHQCSGTRTWKPQEISFLRELAAQVGLSLSGVTLAAVKAAETERTKVVKDVTLRIRQSLDLTQIMQLSVDEVRRAIKTDRVLIYRFNEDWQSGVIIAESVAQGWVRALGQTIYDPLKEGAIERYNTGKIWTTEDIRNDNLSECHCAILERLQVRANIVAPIMNNGKLFGLVCGHQCSGPRIWQDADTELFSQLAVQIGFAMDQASLLKQQEEATERARQLNRIIFRLRESLDEKHIFTTVLEETREALGVDRAIVYLFDDKWQGRIVAESVQQPYPAALGASIVDPCFAAAYVEKYRKGRVQALPNVQEAKLDPCYRSQLEPFEVKANIVAPILVENKLLGLLVVHQCSGPRNWKEGEISFFRQVAIQLGFVLDQSNLLKRQQVAIRRAQQLNEITFSMRESLNKQQTFSAVVQGTREALVSDRVVVYLFDEQWHGTVVAESVGRGWTPALGANIADPCFAEAYIEKYRRGRVQALSNVQEAELDPCYRSQLDPFEVKANVVAPILVENKLLGLLVTHQCSAPRVWQEDELSFFRQVAIQLGFALEQIALLEQREEARLQAEAFSREQRYQNEELQQQLVELLEDIEGAARGDLTVRADVTVGEIGTVADFFNSIVESLRQIVTQVKHSALQVNASLSENEGAIRVLAEQALKQAEETTLTLESVEKMTHSIQAVATNARQAAEVARSASATAEVGGNAMDLTVQNILSLRETIGETAKKVKRLGESSQQIAKVVSLINQIALQTNLLAINAGIEAARAGEEGQGFAVVAEEVGELAARSATATQEIEQIVETIQRETSEVVEAMEQGTAQVVEGTHLVKNAKQSLEQILAVSRQIDQLVQSISEATVSQVETSHTITHLMEEVAMVAGRTSDSSHHVSTSLRQTVEIARELQASVSTFKVN